MTGALVRIGAVVIGRNEGERLGACLASLAGLPRVVYVDSGSTDGSVAAARSRGVEVVALDPARPFSAARARNEGFAALLARHPELDWVAFVDGDCRVVPGWLDRAVAVLASAHDLAVVCGRRREEHPERSLYQRVLDLEWDGPIGDVASCGGDCVVRAEAFRAVGGFEPSIAAGEEPELCARLRRAGWRVQRLADDMTLHDAGLLRFSQWWRRNLRTGYGACDVERRFAPGAFTHLNRSARWWAVGWPSAVLGSGLASGGLLGLGAGFAAAAVVALAFPAQLARVAADARRQGARAELALLHALLVMLGKLPQLAGQLACLADAGRGARRAPIEYRGGRPSRGEVARALRPGAAREPCVAYLTPEYPKVSHSFIRREVQAIEAEGIRVARFTVRPAGTLADPGDREEQERTRALLGSGPVPLAAALLGAALSRPLRLAGAALLATRLWYRSDRGLLRHVAYLAEASLLQRWLAACGARHLHAHFGVNSTTVAMLCHALGGPGFSFTAHGATEFDRLGSIGIGVKLERARFAVAVSRYGRSQLLRWCEPRDWGRIHVIHCGVDEEFLEGPPLPIGESRLLVSVGRLSPEKGHALLLEAAGELARRGASFELWLVGDGELRGELEARITARGMADRVRITGWASGAEVRKILGRARALVLPSLAEGLPVAAMEALALGRPVVATRIAAVPELVRPGENGWLVDAGCAEALAGALEEVLEADVARLETMGASGRALVGSEHRAVLEGRKLADLFLRHAGEGAASRESAPIDAVPRPAGEAV